MAGTPSIYWLSTLTSRESKPSGPQEPRGTLGDPDPAYLLRPPVRRAAPLRAVFLAVDFRLVAFLAVFRLVAFFAVFRLVVFLAVFRLVVFLAVFRLIVFLAVFRADALRLLVAFFFFVGAMLTKPLQTLLVIVNAANFTRHKNLNKHVPLNQRRAIVIQLCQTRNCKKRLISEKFLDQLEVKNGNIPLIECPK